jgi:hypothetical protein
MLSTEARPGVLLRAAGIGAIAGLIGVAAMTLSEKLEQRLTRRPDSYIPARALLTLLGRHPTDADRPWAWNHAMHWGTGALVGMLRGVWAAVGMRGPQAHVAYTSLRLAIDQTVENATGVGAPPRTWPLQERIIDYLHKGVFAIVTGLVAERLIDPVLQSSRGTTSH